MSTTNTRLLEETPEEVLFRPDTEWILHTQSSATNLTGQLIGVGMSHKEQHSHRGGTNRGCTACRWSELYIFRVSVLADPVGEQRFRYCVYALGPSTVEGEITRGRIRWMNSGYEVVEFATVRRGDRGAPYIPSANARALAMAADVDRKVADAYVNRAVV